MNRALALVTCAALAGCFDFDRIVGAGGPSGVDLAGVDLAGLDLAGLDFAVDPACANVPGSGTWTMIGAPAVTIRGFVGPDKQGAPLLAYGDLGLLLAYDESGDGAWSSVATEPLPTEFSIEAAARVTHQAVVIAGHSTSGGSPTVHLLSGEIPAVLGVMAAPIAAVAGPVRALDASAAKAFMGVNGGPTGGLVYQYKFLTRMPDMTIPTAAPLNDLVYTIDGLYTCEAGAIERLDENSEALVAVSSFGNPTPMCRRLRATVLPITRLRLWILTDTQICVATDRGAVDCQSLTGAAQSELAVSSCNPEVGVVAGPGGRVRATNNGKDWVAIDNPATSRNATAVYLAPNGVIHLADDSGTLWRYGP